MKVEKKKNSSYLYIGIILVIASITSLFLGYFNNDPDNIIFTVGILFLPILIELIRRKDPVKYYGLTLQNLKSINVAKIIMIGVIICLAFTFFDITVFKLYNILYNPESNLKAGGTAFEVAKSKYFYMAPFVIVVGTLTEELWFRGMLQVKLSNLKALSKANPAFAILFQSVLFGLLHFIPVLLLTNFNFITKLWFFVYAFIIAGIMGYLNEKSKSLWPGWIIHFTNNFIAVVVGVAYVRFFM